MAHTHTCLVTHLVFSTAGRMCMLTPRLTERLFPYMGGIVRALGGSALMINGPSDHVHLLAQTPPTLAVSVLAQRVKGRSSSWVHETLPDYRSFAWQDGYAAFTVGQGEVDRVRTYIARQRQHHEGVSFHDELVSLLERHGLEWDERYLLG